MSKFKNQLYISVFLFLSVFTVDAQHVKTHRVKQTVKWSAAKANKWYAGHKWISGANFIPSTAVNQLEMWQADTFDPITIDRELGYAEGIGFNTVRVFLHSIVWNEGPKGFKDRVNQYLDIANKHHIQTIFVFFDDCWNDEPKPGKQPPPKAGIHNSGWEQDPGGIVTSAKDFAFLQRYVDDMLRMFGHDKRVLLWDLYNEPGNSGKKDKSEELLKRVFAWARAMHPQQPLSAGLWNWTFENLNKVQVDNSDVITYHDYDPPEEHLKIILKLKMNGRPLICTEYMARTRNSEFENIMPMLKQQDVGAINWGLVSGKTNTIYAWDTPMTNGAEPRLWFHDIFKKDGTPYKQKEVDLIKDLNAK